MNSNSDDQNFLVQSLFKDATARIKQDRDRTHFTHAFVNLPIFDTLQPVKMMLNETVSLDFEIFGVTNKLEPCARFFMAPFENTGTVLWISQKNLIFAKMLSQHTSSKVHWLSVYEAYNCRAYIQFNIGSCAIQILDPISYWKENILAGKDIVGAGQRQFSNLSEFLNGISDYYKPVIQSLDYESIGDELNENNGPLSQVSKIISVETGSDNSIKLNFFGEWDSMTIEKLQALIL
jgi:hypothetical protein